MKASHLFGAMLLGSLFWAACVAVVAGLPKPLRDAPQGNLLETPAWLLPNQVLRSMFPSTRGAYLHHFAKRPCQPRNGVNPYIWAPSDFPAVGKEAQLLITTRACDPYPVEDVWIIMGFRLLSEPTDFSGYGMDGCVLLVDPATVTFVPAAAATMGIVQRDRLSGEVRLRWTPPTWAAGTSVFIQAVVAAPGENRAGLLSTHCVELRIGP